MICDPQTQQLPYISANTIAAAQDLFGDNSMKELRFSYLSLCRWIVGCHVAAYVIYGFVLAIVLMYGRIPDYGTLTFPGLDAAVSSGFFPLKSSSILPFLPVVAAIQGLIRGLLAWLITALGIWFCRRAGKSPISKASI